MASSYSAQISAALKISESILAADYPGLGGQVLDFSQFNSAPTFDAGTTPAISKAAVFSQALTAGSATIDLTAVTIRGVAVTLSGLKPVAWLFRVPAGSAGAITIAKGASNGYTGLGSSASILVPVGWTLLLTTAAGGVANPAVAVSGSVKTLDISGTGTDTLQVAVVAGA